MNGHRNKYFSQGIVFYNYSFTMLRQSMLSSTAKNSQNGNFPDFIDQKQTKKIWQIWSNFTSRGGSRAGATSNMERFVIIVNDWKPITIITKRSILNVAAALDPPLTTVAGFILCNYIQLLTFKQQLFVGKRIYPYISRILQISLTQRFFFIFYDKCQR